MKIELKILEHAKEFYSGGDDDLPSYATPGSAGVDLMCIEDVTVCPGEVKEIKTGLAIHIGSAWHSKVYDQSIAGFIVPRSGLGFKGLILANTIGVWDDDYQGEIVIKAWNRHPKVHFTGNLVHNCMKEPEFIKNTIELKAGDRIAQLLFVPIIKAQWEVVDEFSNKTERGNGSFGSTGK